MEYQNIIFISVILAICLFYAYKMFTYKIEQPKMPSQKSKEKPKKKPKAPKPPKPELPRLESCRTGQYFGFLHDIKQGTPIADNCFDCPKLMDCMKKKVKK